MIYTAGWWPYGRKQSSVLTDSFHVNEWRGIDFMELGCIDLWLTCTF